MSLELPFGIKVINPVPLDSKYLNTGGTPYATVSEANLQVPYSIRHIGLTVNINGVEYWYKDGIFDFDLIIKSAGSLLDITGYTAATEVRLQQIESDIFDLQVFSANTTNTINDIQSDISYISGITSSKQDALTAGRGISAPDLANDKLSVNLSGYTAQGNINLTITGATSLFKVIDSSGSKRGIQYDANYHPFYTNRSLVDKEYVDGISAGLSAKNAVNLATTGYVDVTGNTFSGFIDGVTPQNGWRILVKNQPITSQNGIYVYSATTFTRSEDFNNIPTPTEITSGSFTTVISGITQSKTAWIVTSPSVSVVDFEPIIWSSFILPAAGLSDIQNIGTGEGVVSGTTANIAYLKSLVPDGDIEITADGNEITINSEYFGSSTASTVNLGGISAGYILTGKTFSTILQDLLSPALNPTLVAPSATFVMSPYTNGQNLEVGTSVNITFTAGFNRGSISPLYCGSSQYRSGYPNFYSYTGFGLISTGSTLLNNIQTVTGHNIIAGSNSWISSISYDSGDTAAFNSACGVFSPALVAGNTISLSRTLNGIYPYFYGKFASGGAPAGVNRPAATNSLVTGGSKVVASSIGTIVITFGATSDDYLWFAIPSTSTSKTKWYVDALNNGNIGGSVSPGGNLFPTFDSVNVTTIYWAGIQYKVYISNYQTATTGAMEMRNS